MECPVKVLPVLPPEIWQIILARLDDPVDILHAMQTCRAWEDILQSKKQMVLMLNVLPLVTKYLPPNTALKCREVCRPVKTVMDNLMEKNPKGNEKLGKLLKDKYNFFYPPDTNFGRFPTISNFLARMTPPHECVNPFVGRSVTINLGNRRRYQEACGDTLRLLEKYGSHLRSFEHRSDSKMGLGNIIQLPAYFKNIVNLESLKINWEYGYELWNEAPEVDIVPSHDDIATALQTPFPPLKNLTSLDYNFNTCYLIPLGMSLLQAYGVGLTTLACKGRFLEDFTRMSVKTLNSLLPNLKHLKIDCASAIVYQKLGLVNWRLESLQLAYHFPSLGSHDPWPALVDLVLMMNNFKDTLTCFEIHRSLRYHWHEVCAVGDANWNVEMPQMKRLKTTIPNVDEENVGFWRIIQLKCKN